MQLRHVKTLISPEVCDCGLSWEILQGGANFNLFPDFQDAPSKITAVAWAPNNNKLAVATVDRIVYLFDDQGEKKDRFPTKPAESSVRNRGTIAVCGYVPITLFPPAGEEMLPDNGDGILT